MKAYLDITCYGCERKIGRLTVDTADVSAGYGQQILKAVLAHRNKCTYYGGPCNDPQCPVHRNGPAPYCPDASSTGVRK